MWGKIKVLLEKLADCLNEHWIWKTIILFLPSVYMPVLVKYAGDNFGILDGDGKLTQIGIGVTIVLYICVLGINILANYKSKLDKRYEAETKKQHEEEIAGYQREIECYDNTLAVHTRLLNVIGNICDVKLGSIYSYIESSFKCGIFQKPFNETVYPEKQLKSIAKELKTCLSEITQPPFNQISVSMAYEFPKFGVELKWIDQQEIAQCMQLNQLKKNKSTTFYKIYSGQSDFIFFNDKEKAASDGNYVFDKKDHRYHKVGSIICDEIAIEDEKGKIARIILTISTYGYKFTDSDDDEILKNMSDMIEEVILQQFEKRIRIELAFLFVKNQYNRK